MAGYERPRKTKLEVGSRGASAPASERAAYAAAFSRRLRDLMRDRGLTQAKLAARAGITRAHVNYLCSCRRSPSIYMLRRLADALGTTADDLLPEIDGEGCHARR